MKSMLPGLSILMVLASLAGCSRGKEGGSQNGATTMEPRGGPGAEGVGSGSLSGAGNANTSGGQFASGNPTVAGGGNTSTDLTTSPEKKGLSGPSDLMHETVGKQREGGPLHTMGTGTATGTGSGARESNPSGSNP